MSRTNPALSTPSCPAPSRRGRWLLRRHVVRGAQGRAPQPGNVARGLLGSFRSPAESPPSVRRDKGASGRALPHAAPSSERRDKMLPGLRRLLQGRDIVRLEDPREGRPSPWACGWGSEGGGVGWEQKNRLAREPRLRPHSCQPQEGTGLGACGSVRGARDQGATRRAERAGWEEEKEARVPLSRLHLLRGTPRTRAGWGSADSATPSARCLSTFQSPGKTSHVGRGLSGKVGGRECDFPMALPDRTDGGSRRLVPCVE